jgi:hypothetical protein
MRKILLPPLLLLLLVACAENGTVMSPREPGVRFDVNTEAELTATAVNGKILPAAYALAMGESNNSWPHARGNMRYQQIFLGTELGDMDRIAGLCLRHDELVSGRQLTENLTVKLGPTNLNNTNLGNTFDANYSSAPTQVFSDEIIIPATTGAGTIDMFDFCIQFTTEYVHEPGANLIVEMINTGTSQLTHAKDACSASASGCTTRRVVAFSASATTATQADNSGLIMSFFTSDPTEKADCTEERWIDFGFKNQGQCIRFVETEKDSRQ